MCMKPKSTPFKWYVLLNPQAIFPLINPTLHLPLLFFFPTFPLLFSSFASSYQCPSQLCMRIASGMQVTFVWPCHAQTCLSLQCVVISPDQYPLSWYNIYMACCHLAAMDATCPHPTSSFTHRLLAGHHIQGQQQTPTNLRICAHPACPNTPCPHQSKSRWKDCKASGSAPFEMNHSQIHQHQHMETLPQPQSSYQSAWYVSDTANTTSLSSNMLPSAHGTINTTLIVNESTKPCE